MKDYFLPVDMGEVKRLSGNMYRSVVIIGKRANQHTADVKEELTQKLSEFAPAYDNLEEIIENKEQIEISRYYEKKPKPTQIALEEFIAQKVYFRDPNDVEQP